MSLAYFHVNSYLVQTVTIFAASRVIMHLMFLFIHLSSTSYIFIFPVIQPVIFAQSVANHATSHSHATIHLISRIIMQPVIYSYSFSYNHCDKFCNGPYIHTTSRITCIHATIHIFYTFGRTTIV